MVKGSNSLRNKKLHSSKPYDVSNSFVKKVTSHVTNLIPQPAWLSKWFSSNVDDGHRRDILNSNDSGSEDEDDDNTEILPPPSKRAKIPLNQHFPSNSFKVSPVKDEDDQAPYQHASTSRTSTERFVNDGAVAGPSGISLRPPLVSSTPNVEPPTTSLLSSSERKLNGDDRSESSESTSGCSSLVPQANRQFQASEIASSNLSAHRRSIDEKLNFTGHLQSPRSLFSDGSYSRSPRLNPSLSRRRIPSFNVSTFGSPVTVQDRNALQSRIVNSPFYSGQTTFGGASAYRKLRDSFQSPSEVSSVKRCSVPVKPANCQTDTLTSMSTTARRILEALEQFSSPVVDAKRIPVQPKPPALCNKRKHQNDTVPGPSLSSRTGQSPRTPNSARPLIVPTVPDLLKIKHREKLQDSLEAARLVAASSSINTKPIGPSTSNSGYRLRFEEKEEKSGRHGGKIRSKEKELEEERVEELNLPKIPLPVTSLPKFDFVVPPAPVSSHSSISTFKFASPITVTENTRTCKPIDNFTFSKPLSIGNKDIMNHNAKKVNCIGTSIPNCPSKAIEIQFASGSDSKLKSKGKEESKSSLHKNNNQNSEVVFGIKVADELKSGSVMDILGKTSNSADKKNSKELISSNSSSLDAFRPAAGTWECSSCLIRNKSDVTKCVICETPRTSVSTPSLKTPETWVCKLCHADNAPSFKLCSKCSADRSTQTSSQQKEPATMQEKPQTSISDFGNKFKPPSGTWECNTCLVRNAESLTRCQACETKRPGLANKCLSSKPSTNSGFGERFKKPEGSWECPDCMVQNKSDSLKCIACEKAKPGTETKSASTTKFNFAIPAEASGFKFGLDKAGDTAKESTIQPSGIQGFKFGETKITSASNVTFGVNVNTQTATKSDVSVSNTTLNTPNFNFGTSAFSLPVSNAAVKPSDTATLSQPGLTFGVTSQLPKFQSPTTETKKSEEVPKKRRASDTGETVTDSKAVKPKQDEGTSSLISSSNIARSSEEKPEPTKKVKFPFGSAPQSTNDKPNIATKTVEDAKPSFNFGASSTGLNFNAGKQASFTFSSSVSTTSSSIFGNNITTATNAGTNNTTTTASPVSTAATATTTASAPFTLSASKSPAAFGSNPSSIAFGAPSASAPSTISFGTGLKTTNAVSTFSFGSQSKPFGAGNNESTVVSKSQTPFGSTTIAAFGSSSIPTATTTPTTTTISTASSVSSIAASSLPSFGTASTTASFSLGAKTTIPAFGTVNTTTTASTTTSTSFGSIASANFNSTFSDQNNPASKSISSAAQFTFGSSTNNNTSSLVTPSASFAFGNTQNDQGLPAKDTFTFGAPNNNTVLTSGTSSTTGSGFAFVANNPTAAFNFGSNASTQNPAAPSLFGSSSNNTQTPATGSLFGAPATGTFGNNPTSAGTNSSTGFSAPAFNFNAGGTQPASNVFGFTGNQASGTTSTSGQSFNAPTPNFNFGQTQTPAQTPGQSNLPTFDPNMRPTYNFTKGETPAFTAAGAPGPRLIKKAKRRTAPR